MFHFTIICGYVVLTLLCLYVCCYLYSHWPSCVNLAAACFSDKFIKWMEELLHPNFIFCNTFHCNHTWLKSCFYFHTGVGVILCIEKALAHSGVSKEDVNYINAHATSTPAGDLKEYQALFHCFGQNPGVSSVLCATILALFRTRCKVT